MQKVRQRCRNEAEIYPEGLYSQLHYVRLRRFHQLVHLLQPHTPLKLVFQCRQEEPKGGIIEAKWRNTALIGNLGILQYAHHRQYRSALSSIGR